VAEKLGAPVAKALLGKAVLPDDSPYTTGSIGHLGTVPSHQSMQLPKRTRTALGKQGAKVAKRKRRSPR
jgi:hypothetical protein